MVILKKIVSSIWFLALLIAIPIIIFLPDVFEKYKVELLEPNYCAPGLIQTYYVDLNNDGEKEHVVSFLNNDGKRISVHYLSESGSLIDQLNFRGNYTSDLKKLYFGDIDKNGFTEIYCFSLVKDSLFLNWFEPLPDTSGFQKSIFITSIGTYGENQYDMILGDINFVDLTNDNKPDLVFPVGTGYSLKPRNIFIADVFNDTVYKSDYLGVNADNIRLIDLNNDHKPEIIFDNSASGNLKDSIGRLHIDNRPWLKVLNSDLTPFFEPVPFSKGLMNKIKVFAIGGENKNLLLFHINLSDTIPDRVYLYSNKGNLLKSTKLPSLQSYKFKVYEYEGSFFVFDGNHCFVIDSSLEVTNTLTLPVSEKYNVIKMVNLNAGFPELILTNSSDDKIVILTDKFKRKVDLEFPEKVSVGSDWNYLGNGEFTVISSNEEYHYKFMKNKIYFLRFPFYILVYLVSVGFIHFIQAIQKKQLQEKYELQNYIRDLELKTFQSQMDPHFMFNAFTSMASLLKKGDQESAYNSFMKFSKMVRINLENSNRLTRTLKEELEVVEDFLSLNKLRFKDKLDYSINNSDNINQLINVPKMILQIHVENALKHGLKEKKDKGFIKVEVKRDEKFISMIVEDNGIGRIKAKALKRPSTKKGLKMLEAMYNRLNSINKNKIQQQFVDLRDSSGEPSGTRVEIRVPVNLKE